MIKVILLGFVVILSLSYSAEAGYCENPVPASNFDVNWLMKNSKLRIQFGSPQIRKRFAQWILGKRVGLDADYSKMCTKDEIYFEGANLVGNFTGYGGKVAKWSCLEKSLNFGCDIVSPNSGFNDAAKIHLSYFDAKSQNVMGCILCFQNGNSGYMALTISKTINNEETKALADHFKSHGFNVDARVPMHSASCK